MTLRSRHMSFLLFAAVPLLWGGFFNSLMGQPPEPVPVGPPPVVHASSGADLLEQGETALREGRYGDAHESIMRAIEIDPNDPRTKVSLALCEFMLGDFETAATSVHEVMKMAPDLASSTLDLRASVGEFDTFENQFNRLEGLATLQPESSRLRYLLGFMQYFSGDRTTGADRLFDYSVANPDDYTIRPFIMIARDSGTSRPVENKPLDVGVSVHTPFVDVHASYHQKKSHKAAIEEEIAPPRPIEPPPQGPPPVAATPYVAAPTELIPPPPPGPPVVVETSRAHLHTAAPRGERLEDVAIEEFCRAHHLDPVRNNVMALVTDQYFDDGNGRLYKAKVKVRWVEWKDHGRKAKQKSDTVKLRFDKHGRMVDYDD